MNGVPDDFLEWFRAFPARLDSITNTNGVYYYGWTELVADGSGGLVEAVPARTGNTNVNPAFEINGRPIGDDTINTTPTVMIRSRGTQDANTIYEFNGAGLYNPLVVRNAGDTKHYAYVDTLVFYDGFTTGINISNPSQGAAWITIDPASTTTAGIVNTNAQTWTGNKTLEDASWLVNDTAAFGYGFFVTEPDGGSGGFGYRYSKEWMYTGSVNTSNTWLCGVLSASQNTFNSAPALVMDPHGNDVDADTNEEESGRFIFSSGYTQGTLANTVRSHSANTYPRLYLTTIQGGQHYFVKGGTGTDAIGNEITSGLVTAISSSYSPTLTVGSTNISGGSVNSILINGVGNTLNVATSLILYGGTF